MSVLESSCYTHRPNGPPRRRGARLRRRRVRRGRRPATMSSFARRSLEASMTFVEKRARPLGTVLARGLERLSRLFVVADEEVLDLTHQSRRQIGRLVHISEQLARLG